MTKFISILILTLSISFDAKSQMLNGEWEGEFTDGYYKYPIFLDFTLNPDSSYTVYSYSKALTRKEKDTVIVCLIHYEIISQDSIYLEEVEPLESAKYLSTCLQKMFLKINKIGKEFELVGEWENTSPNCQSSGIISFQRRRQTELLRKRKKLTKTNAQH